VILKVGDESVTQGELEAVVNSLTAQAQKSLSVQGRRPLGNQYALMILLSQEAVSHHLDSTVAFQRALAMARRQILAQTAYQEIVRESAVTPEETSKYFAAHQSEFEEAMIRQVVIRKRLENAKEGTPGLTAQEAKTRAEEIRKALSSGDDPKKVAEQFQVANVVRVDAEPSVVRRGSLRADLEKAAFELKDGQVSEVFDFPQSLVFIQVVSHKTPGLKDVSSQIESTIRQQKVNSTLDELKKNAKIWMDDAYFAVPSQPGSQGAVKIPTLLEGPASPK
jgi:parvulin-like peptidyl-prolyl isomerase